MKLAFLSFFALLATLCPAKSMGIFGYLVEYSINREYSARYAPYAITRNLGVWPPWQPRIIEIKNSRILWPIFSTRNPSISKRLSVKVFEPIAYYLFMPLVEIDCTINGHPKNPSYDWKFFGSNSE